MCISSVAFLHKSGRSPRGGGGGNGCVIAAANEEEMDVQKALDYNRCSIIRSDCDAPKRN